jgi:hypothetical protein
LQAHLISLLGDMLYQQLSSTSSLVSWVSCQKVNIDVRAKLLATYMPSPNHDVHEAVHECERGTWRPSALARVFAVGLSL